MGWSTCNMRTEFPTQCAVGPPPLTGAAGGSEVCCDSPRAHEPPGMPQGAHSHHTPGSCAHRFFSLLIPHARLMNNVITGAITLFLNAF